MMSETSPITVAEADQKLQAALAEAQGEFPVIPKDRTVKVTTKAGGSYTFAYAPLDSILTAVRPVLAKHGLAIVQRLEAPNGQPSIRTELLHRDGGRIASSFPLGPMPEAPQDLGSLLTYLRRYAVAALLCVAAEDDEDAGSATIRGEDPRAAGAETQADSQFRPPETFQAPDPAAAEDISEPQRKKIYVLKTKLEKAEAITEEAWQQTMSARYGTEKVSELTKGQASDLIERLVNLEQLL
jgi:hypothetical protein